MDFAEMTQDEEGLSFEDFSREVEADEKAKGMVKRFSGLAEAVDRLRVNGLPRGVSTGWGSLDECYRVPLGQWTLVTGIPGHGKSSFLTALMVNLMAQHDWKFIVYSAENLPHENFTARLLACYLGKPFHHGFNTRLTKEEVADGMDFLDAHCKYLDPGLDAPSVAELLAALREEHKNEPFQGVVLDPWNEISHVARRSQTETQLIGEELGDIRRFCRHSQVHTWVVAHPQKMQRIPGSDENAYHIPTPWDVSGSAHFRNKADFSLTVHRPQEGARLSDIHIQKVRFSENGRLGKVQLDFDLMTGRFSEQSSFQP